MSNEKKTEEAWDANVLSSTPYDDVFRTLLNDCSKLIIPVINLAFDEHFSGDEEIVFHPNELFLRQQGGAEEKRITDTYFTIHGYKEQTYHWECTSSDDNTILIRVVEYDLQIALQSRRLDGDTLYLKMPKSAVLYLRHKNDTPDFFNIEISAPEGVEAENASVLRYRVPTLKAQTITIDEIFEKKLFFLIPFYIFSYEAKFEEYEKDEGKRSSLQQVFVGIRYKLDELEESGEINTYTKIIILDMSGKVIKNLARKREKISREVGGTMLGPTLDHAAKRLLRQGIAQVIERALRKGNTPEEVADFNDIPLEDVLEVQKNMMQKA